MTEAHMPWRYKRLRYLADFNPAVPPWIRRSGTSLPLFPMDAIHEFSPPSEPNFRPVDELLQGYSYLDKTDVAYAKVTPCFENGKGVIGSDLEGPSFATTEVTVLRPRRGTLQRFIAYTLQSTRFRSQAIASMTGTGGLKRVSEADMKNYMVPVPDPDTQRAVSDYLDHETAELDAFVSDQQQLLALARERHEAEVALRVAGADTAVQTVRSPTHWMPGVPTPYDIVNIRRVAAMRTGHTPSRSTPAYWSGEQNIPWFTLADVWQLRAGQKYLGETTENITKMGLDNSAADLLPKGTVILSRTASVGFTGIMPQPMATSQDYWNWVCTDYLDPEFLWYQFRAMRPEFDRIKSGSTHKTIYQADAAALRIVLPPIEEQRKIVSTLNERDEITSAIVDDAARAITLAKERRAALITAAVTGRIDVTAKRRPAAEQLEDDIKELS